MKTPTTKRAIAYSGFRGGAVRIEHQEGNSPLPPRNGLRNHSPDGFNWGYAGSGPAQLALALCCNVLEDDTKALGIYQAFKFAFVAELRQDEPWCVSRKRLQEIMDGLLAERARVLDGPVARARG